MADISIPEEWRQIAEFPDFSVSNLGRVRRDASSHGNAIAGRIMSTKIRSGYPAVGLTPRRTAEQRWPQRWLSVHILVCGAFHGPRPSPAHQVAHWDGNKLNPKADNLRWVTHHENCVDDRMRLRECSGVKNGRAKLSETDVRVIKNRLAAGEIQQRIADDFGITQAQVSTIKLGKQWAWV